jgi:hypothetical protein
MHTNMLLSLVGGRGLKGEESPSILILASSTLISFSKAFCFVDWIPWHWPLRCPFAVSSKSGMYLWMSWMVSLDHVA